MRRLNVQLLACNRIALALNLAPVHHINTSDTGSHWRVERLESIVAERQTCRLDAAHSKCPFTNCILDEGAWKLSQDTIGAGSRELLDRSESVDLSSAERFKELKQNAESGVILAIWFLFCEQEARMYVTIGNPTSCAWCANALSWSVRLAASCRWNLVASSPKHSASCPESVPAYHRADLAVPQPRFV